MKENNSASRVSKPQSTDKEMLFDLQRETFDYFIKESNSVTGLIADKTQEGSPASIGVVGMGLSVYIIGVERNYISKKDAITRVLKILRFFYTSEQSTKINATGYKGFYYHFIEMETGKRTWNSELSTIDTAFFIAGALSSAIYFSGNNKEESEIRELAENLYKRIDWHWALNGGITLCHGWMPETGFLDTRWNKDYNEAIILYILALGSPTHSIKTEGYKKWTETFQLKSVYNIEYLYAGPLFIHQTSHLWIDFRNIMDDFNKKAGFDYFENSRRATYVQREYAIENPKKFKEYGSFFWGLTASDGPGNSTIEVDGIKREFKGYIARGAPFGPDDGTISPWATVASLPFAPEIVLDTIRNGIEQFNLKEEGYYGFDASFNPTYPEKTKNPFGWVAPYRFGLNQAFVIIMIENYDSELIWKIMWQCPYIIKGLHDAGFTGERLGF